MNSSLKTKLHKATAIPKVFSYYEHKYIISHINLTKVKNILECLFGKSDPFPSGMVDSIYYDTREQDLLSQCLEGVSKKEKFRIRGYGNASYLQVHEKLKNLSGVSKYKAKFTTAQTCKGQALTWQQVLQGLSPKDRMYFTKTAAKKGILYPSVRINYQRHRYRRFDYRFTLDTNIEAFRLSNGLPHKTTYARLPWHVLEIKTKEEFPSLPFLGLIKTKKEYFSKFMLGLNLLNNHVYS